MRLSKKDLMDKLSVGYELGPYETFPWSHYDGATGQSCSAEVRMDPDGNELEAEVQMMYDTPPEGRLPMEQFFWMKSKLSGTTGEWEIIDYKLKGAKPEEEIYNWQEKSCKFFSAVVEELLGETMPDLEELIDLHFHSRERLADQSQGGGGKSPKINTSQLMDMKKRGGF
ncbi:MAG: hypothetical protein H6867_03155 [Rhodospirillales bacterium]|nr:hypothetical protein [Rhodospirillales bacterium]MCB9996149.1 hypothetical protein [Rhodospirillales bacterium]